MQRLRIFQKVSPEVRLRQGLTFLRFAIGCYFLWMGYDKVKNPQFAIQLPSLLHAWSQTTPLFWYEDFLKFIVIPQSSIFGALVSYGEVLIGVSFITGAFIPYTALFAIFLNLNFMLASLGTGHTAIGVNLAFILISLVLFWTEAGRYFGLDAYFFRDVQVAFHRVMGPAAPPPVVKPVKKKAPVKPAKAIRRPVKALTPKRK